MIFILSFAVFGASGKARPFPSVSDPFTIRTWTDIKSVQWAGNPTKGNVDYCNGNGALE